MALTCPNKRLRDWKDLVKVQGEEMSYFLWNEYEGIVPREYYEVKEPIQDNNNIKLSNKLQSFLNKLNFTVEFKEDLNSEYNPQSLTDLIYKTILIHKDYKNSGLLKETAYIAYSFLGRKNKIRTDLIHSIENIDNYQEIYNKYKKRSPQLIDYKIKELIVVDFIADAIKNNFETPRDSYQNKQAEYWQIQGNSKLEKQIKYLLAKVKQFIETLINDTKLSNIELNDLLSDIANDIINSNFSKFGTTLSEQQQITNYENTIKRDAKAKDIIENFQKLNLLLTGSLSLRKQGTLYRESNEDLHDLDFTITSTNHGEYFNSLITKLEKDLDGSSDIGKGFLLESFKNNLAKEYIKHPILKKIKSIYPSFEITNVFNSNINDGEVTISGNIDGYAIDLFFVNSLKLDTVEKSFQDWESIFKAKLQMGRAKDIRDFANYVPFNKKEDNKFGEIKGFRHFSFNLKEPTQTTSEDIQQPVKEGVDFVFEQNTELASIGSTEQYSAYLETIFPDYIDNFAYEAVEELLVANKIIDRKC